MSDFDKEAERQRLKEKYEAEREDREATQHMSELLLKGATMTNAHCGTCGDPIFRYDGQEFCPTCSNQVQNDAETTADADATHGAAATPDAATPDAGRAVDAGTEPTTAAPETGTTAVDDSTQQGDRANHAHETSTSAREASTSGRDGTATTATTGVDASGDAVANVEATVERFAAAAADTDDPERAREYLAVVRDATDTLRTLRGDAR